MIWEKANLSVVCAIPQIYFLKYVFIYLVGTTKFSSTEFSWFLFLLWSTLSLQIILRQTCLEVHWPEQISYSLHESIATRRFPELTKCYQYLRVYRETSSFPLWVCHQPPSSVSFSFLFLFLLFWKGVFLTLKGIILMSSFYDSPSKFTSCQCLCLSVCHILGRMFSL